MRKQELHPRTVAINKTQKNQSKRSRSEALIWLAAHFPAAFDNSLRIRPLKTGIMDDILLYADKAAEAGISKSKLREGVVLFTRRLDYLACLKSREMRIDLEGNEVAEVNEEEADHAATKIKKRIEKAVRNARKIMTGKISNQTTMIQQPHTSYSSKSKQQSASEDYLPVYPARSPSLSIQNTPTQAPKAAVVVKHKTSRQFDPDAVARLKEKLGLSRDENKVGME